MNILGQNPMPILSLRRIGLSIFKIIFKSILAYLIESLYY